MHCVTMVDYLNGSLEVSPVDETVIVGIYSDGREECGLAAVIHGRRRRRLPSVLVKNCCSFFVADAGILSRGIVIRCFS